MRIPGLLGLTPILLATAGWHLLSAQTVTLTPAALSFSSLTGGAADTRQLTVGSSTSVPFAIFSNKSWLKVPSPPAGGFMTPATLTITADPTGMAAGSYSGALTIATGTSNATVNVTFVISPIGVSPTSLSFGPYTVGTVPAAQQNITLSGSGNYSTSQSSCSWLSVSPSFGSAPGTVIATLNGSIVSGLAANTYHCSITITPGSTNTPITVTASLTILPTPQVTVNPTTMTFNVQSGGTNNVATQTLNIATAPSQQLSYFLTTNASDNWITFNPTTGATDATTGAATVTVGYATAGLTPGNTYTGTLTLSTPGGTPTQTLIPVKLNYSVNPFLNVSPSSLNFTAQFGVGNPSDQTITVSSTDGSQTATYAISKSGSADWLVIPNSGNTAAPFTVSVQSTALPPGMYTATITVTPSAAGSTPLQIPVVLTVTNEASITTNVSAMSFPYQIGQSQPPAAQNLAISSSTGAALNYTATPSTTDCGTGWLLLNSSAGAVTGTTGSASPIAVSVATNNLAAGTCHASITITGKNAATGVAVSNVVIPVTVVVSTNPLLVATPAAISFATATGSSPAQQTIALSSTSATDALTCTITDVTASAGGTTWLFAGLTSGGSCNNVLALSVFANSLTPGTYNGTVTVTAKIAGGANTANSPFTIPVTLKVTSGTLTLSPASLSFQYILGGASPADQTVTFGGSQSLSYNAVVTDPATTPWLSVTPASGTTSANPTLTVKVDGSKLTVAQTYSGSITVTSPNAANSPATIKVTVAVSAGTISAPTTTLIFDQVAGGSAPAAQTIAVTGTPGPLNFTVATSQNTPWLSVTPATGTTPGSIKVTASAGSMAVGKYTGNVIITSAGATGSPITVPIVLNVVTSQTLSADPASLKFNFTVGQSAPAAQTVAVTAAGGAVPITVQVPGSAAWLKVTPTSGNTPATLTVTATPGALTAGTYNTTISVTSPNSLTTLSIPVAFTIVQVPQPVVSAIGNAASYATGSISPGENIVIFGTGVGPATLTSGTVASDAWSTTAGNTRVLFDGVPAPVIYASAAQTSVMVPYGVAGRTSTSIVVEYSGVPSTALNYNVVAAAPGIYTLNQSGTGPGAVLNQDGVTVNSPNAPAPRGNVIAVYMTGEGQTTPAGSDGSIIPAIASALKHPLLPVTATVNGISAKVLYYGSAPGLISGVMQVNLEIPATAPTGGAVPVQITVGTASTQTGVTIAVSQ